MSRKAIEHLKTDPVMAQVINRIGNLRLQPRRLPPFQSLVHAIIHQQLNGQAAATIFRRFTELFPETEFPGPLAIIQTDIDKLRQAGLSRAKATYIKDLAQKSLAGAIPSLHACHRLTDDELMQELTAVKGIGRWTVEMLLIFNLGRPDVLPVHDLGIRRGYQIAYRKRRLPEPDQLQKNGTKWAPYRTMASLYLWRAADFPAAKYGGPRG